MDKTYWNGEPADAKRVRVQLPSDGDIPPNFWYHGLGGTFRDAVLIEQDGTRFLIDDKDGEGWNKVLSGGSPRVSHRALPINCEVLNA